VLFGESPYPRAHSANGYAFWDAAVTALWSSQGLSKPVNRATSLRNIIKMLLVAEGLLASHDTSQAAIAAVDKQELVKHNEELFHNMINHGFLLLNASPVLSEQAPQHDARAWAPFMKEILHYLLQQRPHTTFILLGRIATTIDAILPSQPVNKLQAEHPYNLSFIKNQKVIEFFQPFHLLRPSSQAGTANS
jgi:uracil-DNA glycosylase